MRLAVKASILPLQNKVPVGAIVLPPSIGTKHPGGKQAGGSAIKKAKSVDNQVVIDLRTPQQKGADTKAANKLTEELRIQAAVKSQLAQLKDKEPIKIPQYNPQPQQPPRPQQPALTAASSKAEHRTDLGLDFNLIETAVSSFENFHDRRMEKLLQTNK